MIWDMTFCLCTRLQIIGWKGRRGPRLDLGEGVHERKTSGIWLYFDEIYWWILAANEDADADEIQEYKCVSGRPTSDDCMFVHEVNQGQMRTVKRRKMWFWSANAREKYKWKIVVYLPTRLVKNKCRIIFGRREIRHWDCTQAWDTGHDCMFRQKTIEHRIPRKMRIKISFTSWNAREDEKLEMIACVPKRSVNVKYIKCGRTWYSSIGMYERKIYGNVRTFTPIINADRIRMKMTNKMKFKSEIRYKDEKQQKVLCWRGRSIKIRCRRRCRRRMKFWVGMWAVKRNWRRFKSLIRQVMRIGYSGSCLHVWDLGVEMRARTRYGRKHWTSKKTELAVQNNQLQYLLMFIALETLKAQASILSLSCKPFMCTEDKLHVLIVYDKKFTASI